MSPFLKRLSTSGQNSRSRSAYSGPSFLAATTQLTRLFSFSACSAMRVSGFRITTICPPGARMSNACFWVSVVEIVSYTALIGTFVILSWICEMLSEVLRSRTCVAPSDSRNDLCFNEDVVMIGLKPESLASWIAGCGFNDSFSRQLGQRTEVRRYLLGQPSSTHR